MASQKISELPTGTAVQATDQLAVFRTGNPNTLRVPFGSPGGVGLSTFAGLGAPGTAGRTVLLSDSPYLVRDNGATFDYFLNGYKATLLDDSTWTWDNQGGATLTSVNGLAFLTIPNSTTAIRTRYRTAPGTPWTVTALVRNDYASLVTTVQYAGVALRDGTGKLYIFYVSNSSGLQAVKFTNATTFSAIGMTNQILVHGAWLWLRVTDTGTNIVFSTSLDGVNFTQRGTEGRTVFFGSGPTQVGVFGNVDGNSGAFETTFGSVAFT